jgi:hypothetical protein
MVKETLLIKNSFAFKVKAEIVRHFPQCGAFGD